MNFSSEPTLDGVPGPLSLRASSRKLWTPAVDTVHGGPGFFTIIEPLGL
jgi:hypothetical protein